jgi:hypothetical protein
MLALPSKSNVIYLALEPNVSITFSGQNASTDDHHDGLHKVCPNNSRKTSSNGEDASNTLKFLVPLQMSSVLLKMIEFEQNRSVLFNRGEPYNCLGHVLYFWAV